jgi:uncharacterized membrane-anchored protein
MSQFNEWFDTFLEEKGVEADRVLTIETEHATHFMGLDFVLDVIRETNDEEQQAIKNILVKIDFENGNVYHFFEHLAKGLIHQYEG